MNKIALVIAALTLSGAAAASMERPVFQWSPEDLATLDSVAGTHARIETTAKRFCREFLSGTRGLTHERHCIDAVVGEIVDSVNDRRLTAYHQTGTVAAELLARL